MTKLTGRRDFRPHLTVVVVGVLICLASLLLRQSLPRPSSASSTAQVGQTSSPTPIPSLTPTPTEPPMTHVVQSGDTLWDIALRYGTTLDTLLAANPGLNPDLPLMPGVVVLLPDGEVPEATLPSPSWPFTAQVSGGGALNLRNGPGLDREVIVTLNPLTPLTVLGRTEDGSWIEVQTAYQTRGWVYSLYTDVFVDLAQVPIVYDLSVPPVTGAPSNASATPPPTAPDFLAGVTERAREIVRRGRALGNRPNVFSKVGDSITVSPAFLTAIGQGRYNLADYAYLQGVIDFYSQEWARTHNSFANSSLAAGVGWLASQVVTNGYGNPTYCADNETPLECEFRWVRPSVALVMLGTNDVPSSSIDSFSDALRRIIESCVSQGVVPVISTIPPMNLDGAADRVDLVNAEIIRLAREYEVPLWDYHAALMELPDHGLGYDGVHPSWPPKDHMADFSSAYLHYGMTVRNLTALQVLDEIWRTVLLPQTQGN